MRDCWTCSSFNTCPCSPRTNPLLTWMPSKMVVLVVLVLEVLEVLVLVVSVDIALFVLFVLLVVRLIYFDIRNNNISILWHGTTT